MGKVAHIVGVDPGIVHTGVVRIVFTPHLHRIQTAHHVVDGLDAEQVRDWAFELGLPPPTVYIEKYRPRQQLNYDEPMKQGEHALRREIPRALFVNNTGVRKVVPQQVLKDVLKVWSFPTTTHHQDLRSAAQIAVLGMMKDESQNKVLADAIRDYLERKPWAVSDW